MVIQIHSKRNTEIDQIVFFKNVEKLWFSSKYNIGTCPLSERVQYVKRSRYGPRDCIDFKHMIRYNLLCLFEGAR